MMRQILVVAAHPDDEVLGCGGTIAKLVDEGASVHVAFLADGVLSREGDESEQSKAIDVRRLAARQCCDILGVESITFGDFPDNMMDSVPLLNIVKKVEELVEKYNPDTVFTHHGGDLNIDHQRVHEAVVTASRPQKDLPIKTLLFFEVPSSTEWQLPGRAPLFAPNWFFDISSTVERKIRAFEVYAEELRDWPHPRSIKGVEYLARWRGATVGFEAAEAFSLGRELR